MTVPKLDEQAVFNVARQIDAREARRLYLEHACGDDVDLFARVEALLRVYDEQQSFLQPMDDGWRGAVERPSTDEGPGDVIGPYKLLQQIGEGGMGIVFMAEQTEPVRRKVALKIIKPGMDSKQVIARFEAERQALAMMDHANIARVLDAGATHSGRPYFVMELVHGVPITKYCDEHRLTPRQRLELFIPVCQAVQHAHQKGIIHRDLKPPNVLIALYDDKPVPKIIDFGVAKATGQQLTDKTLVTGFGAIVGTLDYMSPEQAEINQLDIDTRSDVYSLGVLLYELLAGNPPFSSKELLKAGMLEMLRVIREQEPSKPSTKLNTAEGLPTLAANRGTEPAKLTSLLRGELDWIVMKALEKDRNRRYETANAFALDVLRYLADEPVLACPPSARYRFRKLVRRNRRTLATLVLLGLMLLTAEAFAWVPAAVAGGGVVAALTSSLLLLVETNRRARQQREQAEKNLVQAQHAEKRAKQAAAKAEAINHFLIQDLLAEAAPERNPYGNRVIVEELLHRAARNVERAFPGQPDVEAAIRLIIGRTYDSLGRWDMAEPQLRTALEIRMSSLGPEHSDTLDTVTDLAVVLEMRGKLAQAEPLFRQAFAGCQSALGTKHPLTLRALHNLAWSLHDRGKATEAESLYRQCLQTSCEILGPEHPATLMSMHHLGWLLWDLRQPADALPLLHETLRLRRQVLPTGHRNITDTLTLLGWVLTDTGNSVDAEPLLRVALETRRKVLPDEHWLTAISANILGGCLRAQGRYGEAEPLLLQSCSVLESASGFPTGRIAEAVGRLVDLYEAWGKHEQAAHWRERRDAAGEITDWPGRVSTPRLVRTNWQLRDV